MKIGLGADPFGLELKEAVKQDLSPHFAAPSTLLRTCFAPLREIFRVCGFDWLSRVI